MTEEMRQFRIANEPHVNVFVLKGEFRDSAQQYILSYWQKTLYNEEQNTRDIIRSCAVDDKLYCKIPVFPCKAFVLLLQHWPDCSFTVDSYCISVSLLGLTFVQCLSGLSRSFKRVNKLFKLQSPKSPRRSVRASGRVLDNAGPLSEQAKR